LNDATTLVVPLWSAVSAAAVLIGYVVGVTLWVYAMFQTKEDAKEESAGLRNEIMRLDADLRASKIAAENRMDRVDAKLDEVREGVSFIRGLLEHGDK